MSQAGEKERVCVKTKEVKNVKAGKLQCSGPRMPTVCLVWKGQWEGAKLQSQEQKGPWLRLHKM